MIAAFPPYFPSDNPAVPDRLPDGFVPKNAYLRRYDEIRKWWQIALDDLPSKASPEVRTGQALLIIDALTHQLAMLETQWDPNAK